MALRHRDIIAKVADRENLHTKPTKAQLTKPLLTRRPALDELSNKLNAAQPATTKHDPVKDSKAVKVTKPPKKADPVPKSYSVHQLETIIDPDADSKNEPQMVTEYLADIYNYLLELEEKYPIRKNFLEDHKSTPRMRAILVNWLVQVSSNFTLCLETLHMCVSIVDRYLQDNPQVDGKTLQLVGTAALLVACKYEEMYLPELKDFVYICDNTFCKREILKMEMSILISLKHELGKPLSIHFLRRYSKVAQVELQHHNLAKYLLELALINHTMSSIKPSLQAAAACCLSMAILNNLSCPSKAWTATLVHYTAYKYSDFKNVVQKLANILLTAETSKHQYVQSKYAESKYSKISTNPKLKGHLVRKLAEPSPKA
ncbi:G2/mitotic-specific cyclin-B-like [Tenebrio molitor]|jgi:hypothetical protein|uniref:G2/mitotic-specific cyclin-B-like n=1 Tax=Tenebrio molitor TaxID=7067 RepID=UPI0036249013